MGNIYGQIRKIAIFGQNLSIFLFIFKSEEKFGPYCSIILTCLLLNGIQEMKNPPPYNTVKVFWINILFGLGGTLLSNLQLNTWLG